MIGIPTDTLAVWSTVTSLIALAVAAAGAIVSYQLYTAMSAAHTRELKRSHLVAKAQIEASRAAAAQANSRAVQLARASAELQHSLEIEKGRPPEFLRASADPLHSDVKIVPSALLSRAE